MSVIPEKVLFVDDDPNILRSFKRQFHKKINIHTAEGGAEALELIKNEGPFAVVVSDMRMPMMDGATLLTKVRDIAPDTIRIILTGQSDMESAIKAVNDGQIFRFLTKPCGPDIMGRTLIDSLTQYRLITAEKVLLENTLTGSVKLLTELLGMIDPNAAKHANGVKFYVNYLVDKLGLEAAWEFDVAAMLSQIGILTLPHELMQKMVMGLDINGEEKQLVGGVPETSARLVGNIPRLEKVAGMIRLQDTAFAEIDGEQYQIRDDRARVGGHLLHVAIAVNSRINKGENLNTALAAMESMGDIYDVELLKLLRDIESAETETFSASLTVNQLKPGMVLNEDVRTHTGAVLVKEGFEITDAILVRLSSYAKGGVLSEPIQVLTNDMSLAMG